MHQKEKDFELKKWLFLLKYLNWFRPFTQSNNDLHFLIIDIVEFSEYAVKNGLVEAENNEVMISSFHIPFEFYEVMISSFHIPFEFFKHYPGNVTREKIAKDYIKERIKEETIKII